MLSKPIEPIPHSHPAESGLTGEALAARRGIRGLLTAIGLGLTAWLMTAVVVAMVILG
jgi:hypothetical protein